MIATVIQGKTYAEILSLLDDPWVELAEIRLDLCPLSDAEIEDLFANTDTPLIATCRADWSAEITSPEKIAGVRNQNQPKMLHPPVKKEGGASKSAKNASALSTSGITPAEAERRLTIAIQAGARFADLEIEAEAGWSKRFRDLCHEYGVEIIRSWHDFSGTPSLEYLQQIQARCYRYGADIAKIVTTATCPEDCVAVLGLYGVPCQKGPKTSDPPGKNEGGPSKSAENAGAPSEAATEPRRLIAFAMGPIGRETRLECLRHGAPFSYASCAPSSAPASPATSCGPSASLTAISADPAPISAAPVAPSADLVAPSASPAPISAGPVAPSTSPAPTTASSLGQYGFEEMHRLVYGGFRGFWRVGGDLAVPCSKSFAQRAIVCAALAEGRSRLRSYTPCADSEDALAVARALGATVRKEAPGASDPTGSATLGIDGIGVRNQNRPKMTPPPAPPHTPLPLSPLARAAFSPASASR